MKNNLLFILGLIIFAFLVWMFTSICIDYSYKNNESYINLHCETDFVNPFFDSSIHNPFIIIYNKS